MRFIYLTLISITLFSACALKPQLSPVSIAQVDIQKKGKMYFELIDSHSQVVPKNRNNLPGMHHDVDENDFLPEPFVKFLENNIVRNLNKSKGLELVDMLEDSEFHIKFELKHFDIYRETSDGAAIANILIGGLIGGILTKEIYTAEIEGTVDILDINSKDVLCTFDANVAEKVEISYNDIIPGYKNSAQNAATELIKQIISGLQKC